jgi:hypothetical protein
MTDEKVISPIKDTKFNSHPSTSPIWAKAYKIEELDERTRGMHPAWYEYTIRFEGLKPLQQLKFREI